MIQGYMKRVFSNNTEILKRIEGKDLTPRSIPYKFKEYEVESLFKSVVTRETLHDISAEGLGVLVRYGVISITGDRVTLLDGPTLMYNINTPISDTTVKRLALTLLDETIDITASEVYCTSSKSDNYVLPTLSNLRTWDSEKDIMALRYLSYMGYNVHFDLEYTLDQFGYSENYLEELILDYDDDVYGFLCSTAKDTTCYTLYYLCRKYDISVSSAAKARFIVEDGNVKLARYKDIKHLYSK